MRRWAMAACYPAFLWATACSSETHSHAHGGVWGRLALVDVSLGQVRVVSLEDGREEASFETVGIRHTQLASTPRYALLEGERELRFLDGGLTVIDHGDHIHQRRRKPALRDHRVAYTPEQGVRSFSGWTTLDRPVDGNTNLSETVFLDESSFLRDQMAELSVQTTRPDRSMAFVFGDRYFVSARDLTQGVTILSEYRVNNDRTGLDHVQDHLCDAVRHVAVLEAFAVVACADGYHIWSQTSSNPKAATQMPYGPAEAPRMLVPHPERAEIFAVYDQRLERIDLKTQKIDSLTLDSTVRLNALAIEHLEGKQALVIGSDGLGRALDLETWTLGQPRGLFPGNFAPEDKVHIQGGIGRVYALVPRLRKVIEIDLSSLLTLRTFENVDSFAVLGLVAPETLRKTVWAGEDH